MMKEKPDFKLDLYIFRICPKDFFGFNQGDERPAVLIGTTIKGGEQIRKRIGALNFDRLFTVRIKPLLVEDYGTLENTMLACIHEVEDCVEAFEKKKIIKDKEEQQRQERKKADKEKAKIRASYWKAGMLL